MPVWETLLRVGGWRIMIYTHDHRPAHVHAVSPNGRAKFLLNCADGPVIASDARHGWQHAAATTRRDRKQSAPPVSILESATWRCLSNRFKPLWTKDDSLIMSSQRPLQCAWRLRA
ncbi:MAG: hypothetical protein B7Z83_05145 [Thiomonas sp. 20-64-5]|nr:MAG: hypothetical protein B7Z83_05145 [Thiomonas sp. 20-64-5]